MCAGILKRLRQSQGATLVEFSMVAFLFIIVLLGVIEMGRMALVFTALSDAAHAGVRYAIVHGDDTGVRATCAPSSCSGITGAVNSYAAAGLINTSNLTTSVSFPDSATIPGSRVTVTVSYTYDPMVSYFSSKLNVNMGSTSQGVIVF
jgi:Flp pilus assembly protein TadG